MEISDYLKVLGKRIWLLILIPLLAGAAAFFLASQQDRTYSTRATVQLPASNLAVPAQVAQQVADFRAAASSTAVRRQVAEETGIPVAQLKGNVKTAQVSDASLVTVSYQSTKPDGALGEKVVESTINNSLDFMFRSRVSRARQQLDAADAALVKAQTEVAAADKAIADFTAANGFGDPADRIRTLQAEISDLSVREAEARAAGQTSQAEVFATEAKARQDAVAALEPVAQQYDVLQGNLAEARRRQASAETARQEASVAFDAAQPESEVTFSGQAVPNNQRQEIIRAVGTAVVVSIPLAIGLILLLETMSRRRAAKRKQSASEPDGEPVRKDDPALVG